MDSSIVWVTVIIAAFACGTVSWERWLLHLERLRDKAVRPTEDIRCTACNGQGTLTCTQCNGTGELGEKVEGEHG